MHRADWLRRYERAFALVAGAVLSCTLLTCTSQAATVTVESSALRVELSSKPYEIRFIERSSGKVLLSTANTAFSESRSPVIEAVQVSKIGAGNALSAKLLLARTEKTARLTIAFLKPEIVRVTLAENDCDSQEILQEFRDQGEHYYGVWEYPFNKSIDNRGVDKDFLGLHEMPDVNYDNVRAPFYVTSANYGVYADTTAKGHFQFAVGGKTGFSFENAELAYDFIYGPSYAEIFSRYNELAGPSVMPPDWAFSTIWWRDDEHDDLRDAANAQEKVIQDADKLRSLHIPASAIWLDRPYGTGEHGWGNMDFDPSFPDPKKMVADLHDRGMYLLLWIANRCSNELFTQGTEKGFLFEREWPAADIRRPEAYDWFKAELNKYVQVGVRGYKIDRGEEEELPRYTENLNAILLPKLAAEGLRAAYGNDYLEFSRNANDTARKYTTVWNGDTRSTFSSLAATVRTAERSGAINFPMWSVDTGGYIGVPSKELFARWLEFSVYSPMMEVMLGPRRTIWYDYDDELIKIAQATTSAHHDLIPYTRSFLYSATQTGMPVVRLLAFAYPEDTNVAQTWDEYLYGSEILVAPVVTKGANERTVYLPAGSWLDYNDKSSVFTGPKTMSAKAQLDTIPLYVREGAIVPRGDIVKVNNNWDRDWKPSLRIEFFPATKSASEFHYFTGTSVETIKIAPDPEGFSVTMPDLGLPGTLEIYCQNAASVTLNGKPLSKGSGYTYDAAAHKLTVPIQGAVSLKIHGAKSLFDGDRP